MVEVSPSASAVFTLEQESGFSTATDLLKVCFTAVCTSHNDLVNDLSLKHQAGNLLDDREL